MSDARRQLRLALGCFRAVGAHPWMLLYPALLATSVIAATIGLAAYVLTGWPTAGEPHSLFRWFGVLAYFVVVPILIAFWSVAFAYECNEVYEGRSPGVGSGVRVATGRLSYVLAAALALGPGSFLLANFQGSGPIGEIADAGVLAASGVAEVFTFPVVATTDGDPHAAFEEILDAMEAEWGVAAVSTASTNALGTVLIWAGIGTGVPLLFLAFWGISFVSVPPWGPFTIPVLLPFAGFWLCLAATAFVRGVINTALYRYAATGTFPTSIEVEPETMVGTAADIDTDRAAHGD